MKLKDGGTEYTLLPCPFCNSDKLKVDSKANGYIDTRTGERHSYCRDSYDVRYGNFSVRCNKCHSRGGVGHTFEEAIKYWNTRDWISKVMEELKELNGYNEIFTIKEITDKLFSELKGDNKYEESSWH